MTEPFIINVDINKKSKHYPIIIDRDDISTLREKIFTYARGNKVLVVISEKVNKLYGQKLFGHKKKLSTSQPISLSVLIIKDGEKEKNFKNYQKILETALKNSLTRKDTIVAVGGGVCGDLTGFAAANYMRGIDFIQVPTTLLACVDSSVGGKTGINAAQGKNLIGAFHQPKAVLINTNFLDTLDEKQFKTGFGEVVKYALIEKSCPCDAEHNLINFLNENIEKILNHNPKTLAKLIEICITLKAAVVCKDEKESCLRKILNFGHTYGHAVEKETGYKKYTHGESVAAGMKFAFNLAFKKGLIDKNYKHFADDLMQKFNFREIPEFSVQKLVEHMKRDKKAENDKITFVLPTDYSKVEIHEINPDELGG
jgi:3-dehydroquinate synthase